MLRSGPRGEGAPRGSVTSALQTELQGGPRLETKFTVKQLFSAEPGPPAARPCPAEVTSLSPRQAHPGTGAHGREPKGPPGTTNFCSGSRPLRLRLCEVHARLSDNHLHDTVRFCTVAQRRNREAGSRFVPISPVFPLGRCVPWTDRL